MIATEREGIRKMMVAVKIRSSKKYINAKLEYLQPKAYRSIGSKD